MRAPRSSGTHAATFALFALVVSSHAACTGTISGQSPDMGPQTDANNGGHGGRRDLGNGGTGTEVADGCTDAPLDLGPMFLRRLSNWELDNTVRDLLGYTGSVTKEFGLVNDALVASFDNNAEGITISTPVLEKLQIAVEGLAQKVAGTMAAANRLAKCDVAAKDCVTSFVRTFGRNAFRRPLTSDELTALNELAATGESNTDAIVQVIQGVLLSPHFLFRPEVGRGSDEGLVALTGYEVATRLSYMLSGTTPSPTLLDAAMRGELDSPQGVRSQAEALLKQPQAKAAVAHFYEQWLQLDALRGVAFDSQLFPDWKPTLADSMRQETSRFIEGYIWNTEGRLLSAFTAKHSFVNAELAKFYGVPAPSSEWQRIEWDNNSERVGLLTQGSVLTQTSKPDHASAIRRGRFVREQVLCSDIPPPPPSVPPLEPAQGKETERQRFERHTKDPACAGCHRLLDPVGFGLSRFNAIGQQMADDRGQPINDEGIVMGFERGGDLIDLKFKGAAELSEALATSPEVQRCMVTQAFRFALGRREVEQDRCAIARQTQAFVDAKENFPAWLASFVASDAFRLRPALSTQTAAETKL